LGFVLKRYFAILQVDDCWSLSSLQHYGKYGGTTSGLGGGGNRKSTTTTPRYRFSYERGGVVTTLGYSRAGRRSDGRSDRRAGARPRKHPEGEKRSSNSSSNRKSNGTTGSDVMIGSDQSEAAATTAGSKKSCGGRQRSSIDVTNAFVTFFEFHFLSRLNVYNFFGRPL